MKVELESGYVLHTRPWRDNSLLAEYFSRDRGRVAFIARGAKSGKSRGGTVAALLQPFTPLQCSWSGRSQLKTLTGCESLGPALRLRGTRLYSGMYMNELLARLLHHDDAHRKLFDHYAAALALLVADDGNEEIPPRQFEMVLLEELGYGFELRCDGLTGEAVEEGAWYQFDAEHGLVLCRAAAGERLQRYRGEDLLRINQGDYGGTARLSAKRLMRQALASHLGDKPLNSRELFRNMSDS